MSHITSENLAGYGVPLSRKVWSSGLVARLLVVPVALCSAGVGVAQKHPTSDFEAVSLKLLPTRTPIVQTGGPGTEMPTRLSSSGISLKLLIDWAYPQYWEKVRGPSWLNSQYSLNAVLPAGTTKEQLRTMMAGLLRDRFGLKFHVEDVLENGYELVAAPAGIKLTKDSPTSRIVSGNEGGPAGLDLDPDGYPIPKPGAHWQVARSMNGYSRITFQRSTIAGIINAIHSDVLRDRGYIADMTGLPGDFTASFRVEIPTAIPEGPVTVGPGARQLVAPSSEASIGAISRALEKAAGLRLRSAKIKIEVMIIDHVEKIPTGN